MDIKIPVGFSSVCAIIGAIALWNDNTQIGGIFIAIAVVTAVLTTWLGRRG